MYGQNGKSTNNSYFKTILKPVRTNYSSLRSNIIWKPFLASALPMLYEDFICTYAPVEDVHVVTSMQTRTITIKISLDFKRLVATTSSRFSNGLELQYAATF